MDMRQSRESVFRAAGVIPISGSRRTRLLRV